MSSAEVLYSARIAYPDYLVRGRRQVTALEFYRSGAIAAVSAGTFALYDPTGATVLEAAAFTVPGGIPTFEIPALSLPATLALGHGYREEWGVVGADGVARNYRRDAALVLHAAYPVVTDADLTAVYSDLARQRAPTVTSFQAPIDEAWKRILGRLEQQGVFPEYVVTSWSLREVHVELTLHLICLDFHRAQGGRWGELADIHKKEFELAWGRLKFVKGSGADGQADSAAMRSANRGVTYTNASPRASWRGFGGL